MNTAGIALAPFAFLLAQWLHETGHYAAVRLVGGDVIDLSFWPETYIDFMAPSDASRRVVLLAPSVVGVATLPVLVDIWNGTVTVGSAVVAISWTIFTLNGGRGELGVRILQRALSGRQSDDRDAEAHPDPGQCPDR
jgi:hypothetical protein